MIAFLTKSDASEGFDQIVNFLNVHVTQYALMVNPTIYVSCIKQFWTFVLIKKSNDVVRLQVLIDRKKVIITEDSIRQALRLDDADSVDCLSNEEIFAELVRMRYEKPSTKLTFYKGLVRNVDSYSKFLMYPRFLQLMINAQVGDLSSHNTKYTSPALTQKVFVNMRRIRKGFLGVDTPLFDGMLTCATLTKQVANLEQDKIAQAIKITKLKQRARRLEKKRPFKRMHPNRGEITELDADENVTLVDAEEDMNADVQGRRRKGVVIQDPKDTATASVVVHLEDEAFARQLEVELSANINWNDVVYQVKRKEKQDNTARKNMMVYLKNMVGFKMDFFKGMTYTKIRPIFKNQYNFIRACLKNGEEEIEEEGSKRKGKNLSQDATKKQRINKETEELKTHLQIIANDDDDVYIEATPLALKNFDREDLEMLWKLVQERFQSLELKNFSDDFLLNTLKIMFERPNVEANI
nr:hypothetical protein [Tanacetum cinerariifolium]